MKYFLYFMILIFAENAMLVNQGSKLPALFNHFSEHQRRNSALTFQEYLALHYGDETENDQDDQRDMELPFKKINSGSLTLAFMAMSANLLTTPRTAHLSHFGTPDTDLITRLLLNSLFRPPKG
jgi:hypothetical protein